MLGGVRVGGPVGVGGSIVWRVEGMRVEGEMMGDRWKR